MATKPDYDLAWAVDPSALKSEPTLQHKRYGWGLVDGIGEKPNLNEVNYWRFSVYKWIEYLQLAESERDTQLADLNFKIDNVQAGPDNQGEGGVGYQYSNESSGNLVSTNLSVFEDESGSTPGFISSEIIDIDGNDVSRTTLDINTSSENMFGTSPTIYDNSMSAGEAYAPMPVNRGQYNYNYSAPFSSSNCKGSFNERYKWTVDGDRSQQTVKIYRFNPVTGKYDNGVPYWTNSDGYNMTLMSSAMDKQYLALGFFLYNGHLPKASDLIAHATPRLGCAGFRFVIIDVVNNLTRVLNSYSNKFMAGLLTNTEVSPSETNTDCWMQVKLERDSDDRVYFARAYPEYYPKSGNVNPRMVFTSDYYLVTTDQFGLSVDNIKYTGSFPSNVDSTHTAPIGFGVNTGKCTGYDNPMSVHLVVKKQTIPRLCSHSDELGNVYFSYLIFDTEYDQYDVSSATLKGDVIHFQNGVYKKQYYDKINVNLTSNIFANTQVFIYPFYLENLGDICTHGSVNDFTMVIGYQKAYRWTDTDYVATAGGTDNLFILSPANLEESNLTFSMAGTYALKPKTEPTFVPNSDTNDGKEYTYGPQSVMHLGAVSGGNKYLISLASVGVAGRDNAEVETALLELEFASGSFTESNVQTYSDIMADTRSFTMNYKVTPVLSLWEGIRELHVHSLSGNYVFNSASTLQSEIGGQIPYSEYTNGRFIYFNSNRKEIGKDDLDQDIGVVRTQFSSYEESASDSFFNLPITSEFQTLYGSSEDLTDLQSRPSPTVSANNDPVPGDFVGYGMCKWFDLDTYPDDTQYVYYSLIFKQYDAYVSGINYVQDALDDLYRQLNVVTTLEAFGGSTVSTAFNNVVSALVNPHRHEETAVSLTSGVGYVVTHNLDKNLVQVAVYDDSTSEEVDVDVTIIDSNSLTVTPSSSFTASLVVLT